MSRNTVFLKILLCVAVLFFLSCGSKEKVRDRGVKLLSELLDAQGFEELEEYFCPHFDREIFNTSALFLPLTDRSYSYIDAVMQEPEEIGPKSVHTSLDVMLMDSDTEQQIEMSFTLLWEKQDGKWWISEIKDE